jgi:hypothetical protein
MSQEQKKGLERWPKRPRPQINRITPSHKEIGMPKRLPRNRAADNDQPSHATATMSAPVAPPDPEEAAHDLIAAAPPELLRQMTLSAAATMRCAPYNTPETKLVNAMDLVMLRKLHPSPDGPWTVNGSTQDYVIEGGLCSCPQGTKGQSRWCKHVVGQELYKRTLLALAGTLPSWPYTHASHNQPLDIDVPEPRADGRWPQPEPTVNLPASPAEDTPMDHLNHIPAPSNGQSPQQTAVQRHWNDENPYYVQSLKWTDGLGVEQLLVIRADDWDELRSDVARAKQQAYQEIQATRKPQQPQQRQAARPGEADFDEDWCYRHKEPYRHYTNQRTGQPFLAHKDQDGNWCRPGDEDNAPQGRRGTSQGRRGTSQGRRGSSQGRRGDSQEY